MIRYLPLLKLLLLTFTGTAQTKSFTTCLPMEQLQAMCDGNIPQYYQTGVDYKGGLRQIKKLVFEKYTPPADGETQTGYLTIRFIVNCRGETGHFEIMQTTKDFKPFNFADSVKDQLLRFTQSLHDWVPGTLTNGNPVDSQKFLTFILYKGQLIEIVPK